MFFLSGKPEKHSACGDEQSSTFRGENAFKIRPEGVDIQEKSLETREGQKVSNI